ncbi:uroporphyrinogen decarboxylase family protein [Methanococcus maripaludis]|uniref:Uroporphyrinogen decarboxylase n=1 Tax=Methanococcus maripaludis TaxID=39152 RepID=A0A8T4H5V4_METMI|nr:uroporphyrinogen decarboxylase family protein [Methanococcus maripaludis]MBM7409186.1 uroporphyrinogen decarboxylase [Methanococcus maripaludis]MBP2218628.1 uroporphyrinogen decarboxylase [Methanococcus maripaludis]
MEVKKDIMTPKERVGAFLGGKPLDRIVTMPIVTSNTAQLIGKSQKEFQLNAEVMAKSHIAGFEKFGYDLIYLFTNCSYLAEAMGQELVYFENEPASCRNPVVKNPEDISKIKVAEGYEANLPVYYEAIELIQKEIGDRANVSVCFSGAFSTASTLRGHEQFIKDTYNNPELCHELMKMATESAKNFITEVVKRGAIPIILEPLSSGSLISPRSFKQFSKPYITELVDHAHELGTIIPLHICGKTTKILEQMSETGADVLSIDLCDLEIAKEKVSGKSVILGNVSPSDDLLFGPVERIHESCKNLIETMNGYEPGFILSTGCETSDKVPMENIQALMDSARSYGVNEDFKKQD